MGRILWRSIDRRPPMPTSVFRTSTLSGSLALLALLAACQRHPEEAPAVSPPEVVVAPVIARQVRISDQFNGRVEAIQSVDVRPRVSGYIDRIAYAEGAEVKPGDLLFVIDPRPYQDAVRTAQARLESARAAAKLAKSRFERSDRLILANAISREDFDSSQANVEQTAADLHGAEAALSTARLNLSFTNVRSPVQGRAGRALLTLGNLARIDESLLTAVVSQDTMYVYFDCDEQSFLRYGSNAGSNSPTVRVGLANEEGYPHTGKVDFLDNRLDPATGTIRARAVVPNAEGKLTPGLFARVHFESGAPEQALLIDDKAVLTDQDRRYVYVVGPDRKAVRKDVVLGREAEGLRIVKSGVRAGDQIIISGLQKVYFTGMPVSVVTNDASAKPAAASVK